MGIFSKIKNILFEDEDEVEEMPVYTKDENKEISKNVEGDTKTSSIAEEPITTSNNSHFRNVKRDIDLNFDEKDVLGEVSGASDIVQEKREEVQVTPPPVRTEKSPFLSFDEDEFERLNAAINKNETRARKEVKPIGISTNNTNVTNSNNSFNRRNNNFSSTNLTSEPKNENADRYKINSGTLGSGKKPFTPSPVISPVYGILDKNYTKNDIIDKQGGLKREKTVKIEKKDEEAKVTEVLNNRNYANETIENLEKKITDVEVPILDKVAEEKLEFKKNTPDFLDEPKKDSVSINNFITEDKTIDDQLDEKFTVEEIVPEDDKPELDEVVEKVVESKENLEPQRKSKVLNDLEKTSTLQILDDIEKELNAIKPITKEMPEEEKEKDYKERLENDTLENDLFNLIDSMYEEGEEESND